MPPSQLLSNFSQDLGKPAANASEPVKLEAHVEVEVGKYSLRCIDILGSGSYSVVWRAEVVGVRTDDGSTDSIGAEAEVALKDVHCSSQVALQQTLFEVQLLMAIESQIWKEHSQSGTTVRLPKCLAHSVESTQDGWCVRTVMTILPGEQLDQWLRREADVAASINPRQAGTAWASHLGRGCAVARELVLQLAPTLERLAPMAWHRDVNSHNVLVSGAGSTFWICDLGLAADARAWPSEGEGPEGATGAWRVTDIGGDCRYWPPSCWMVHCHGTEYLESKPAFCKQYQWRLDLHGLGITAIEVLCSTGLAAYIPDGAQPPERPELDGPWAVLLSAWQRYRDTVGDWWERIYAVFCEGEDLRPVHTWLTQQQVAEKTMSLLADLHAALEECAAITDESTARLLRVLRDLTSEKSDLTLKQACEILHLDDAPEQTPRSTIRVIPVEG